jgi:hypothetical protein
MTKRSGGRLNAGDITRLGGMFVEDTSGFTEILQVLYRKKTTFRQDLKQDWRSVALAQQKAVSIGILRPFWSDAQFPPVQRYQ